MEMQIGAHRVVVEDDVVIAYANQVMKVAELQQILDSCESIYAQFGRIYLVTVMGPNYDLPPDSRKLAAEWGRHHVLTLNIIVGASFAMRTLIGLIARAQKLLLGRLDEVVFAATEAEARKAIAKNKASKH